MKIFVNLAVFTLLLPCVAPQLALAQSDSMHIFRAEEFMAVVKKFHPLVYQAELIQRRADAELLFARGEFDPKFSFNSEQKTFDGKNYYQTVNPQLKIPTWYGIELKTGTEYYAGDNLSPDVTPGRSTYLGISVPLAKNLLLDKRRAQLQQAKIFQTQSAYDRAIMLNDLMRDAGMAYWEWVKASWSYQILEDALKNNEARYRLIYNSARIGERASIDTVEALLQLNQIRLNFIEAGNKVKMTAAELSNYLWKDNNEPYTLPADVRPIQWQQTLDTSALYLDALPDLLQQASTSHPKILSTQQKLLSLYIDKKLKYQDLLPTVNMNANLLNKDYRYSFSKYGIDYANNNSKFGFEIYLPLRLSKERAAYKLSKIKINEASLGMDMIKNQIGNKITYYYSELQGLLKQVSTCETLLQQTKQMFRAEEMKFNAGESSQFMINVRETKVLEVAIKLAELKVKTRQAYVNLRWASAANP